MSKILVVGSGASGVHFALSVLKKGHEVVLLDVGWSRSKYINPRDGLNDLKEKLKDPVSFFLGKECEAVVYEETGQEFFTKYYGFPPSKSHVFTHPQAFKYEADGFEPLVSFAKGGLAEAWTGGAYPLNDYELKEYPFRYSEIEPHYDEVARRIGMNGANDDLARFYPYHKNLLPPLDLDHNSQILLREYEKHRHHLNKKYRVYMGRSRVTTLSEDYNGRQGCDYTGRCLWGCPSESLYTPSITLKECLEYPNLHYISGMYVSHFKYDAQGHIISVVAESVKDQQEHEFTADYYVLAAGTLSSSTIFMESILRETGETIKLTGLMDNRQILVPFLNLRMLGKRYEPKTYQYHLVAVGVESENEDEYIHGQITTLKSSLIHPFIQKMPVDLKTASIIFRNMRASLGIVNLNLNDRRRDTNYLTLKRDPNMGHSKLVIHYEPVPHESEVIKRTIKKMQKFFLGIGCIVLPWMVHVRPMGASVHYSGTLPMTDTKAPYSVSKYCQSADFDNLFIVDGTTIPFLPAKNITFTLMANAVRVAESVF